MSKQTVDKLPTIAHLEKREMTNRNRRDGVLLQPLRKDLAYPKKQEAFTACL